VLLENAAACHRRNAVPPLPAPANLRTACRRRTPLHRAGTCLRLHLPAATAWRTGAIPFSLPTTWKENSGEEEALFYI